MNKKILALAIPNIISNMTIPLLGMVDIAIAGRLVQGDAAIGGIAIAATIFNFIYWNCAFVRMGTSGLTAQAFGARNFDECANILVRSVIVALGIAVLLLIFQRYVGAFSFSLMHGSDEVQSLALRYFYVRIWAAPATVSLYAIHGWFIGMQNSKTPMWTAIVMNIVNLVVGLVLVYRFDMSIEGIAWGTVAAQYCGVLFSWVVWFAKYGRFRKYINLRNSIQVAPLMQFFHVNKNIFIRTACLVSVYTFFTSASSSMGDTTLAVNSLLMQLFTIFSYMSDGTTYAAESLVGRYMGANNREAMRECIRKLFFWATCLAVCFVVIYAAAWRPMLELFTESPAILDGAQKYVIWLIIIPLAGYAPFLMDGILIGATRTGILRNTMFLATGIFFAVYYSTVGIIGNDAIWMSFVVFMVSRGILQLIATKNLRILTR